MSLILTYKVEREVVISILNTIYAIYPGLLFTFFFSIASNAGKVSVTFNLTSANWLTVTLLASYFLLDWLTAI
jgi:hypothetical protein